MSDATKLRQEARGKPCYVRLTGCTGRDEETVLAHLRHGNVAGVGQKPPDILGVPACSFCHSVMDGRLSQRQHGYERYEINQQVFRALCQWQAWLWNQGIIGVV